MSGFMQLLLISSVLFGSLTGVSCRGCSRSTGTDGYVFIPDPKPSPTVDVKTLLLGVKAIALKAIVLSQVLNNGNNNNVIPTNVGQQTAAGR